MTEETLCPAVELSRIAGVPAERRLSLSAGFCACGRTLDRRRRMIDRREQTYLAGPCLDRRPE